MKKAVFTIPLLALVLSCDTSALFKTRLDYLDASMKVFPEKINGTYFYMNDSLLDAFLSSGQTAPRFIAENCNQDTSTFLHYAHCLYTPPNSPILHYTQLLFFSDSMIKAGMFASAQDTFRWNKIHDNLIELQGENFAGDKDSTYYITMWRMEGLYYMHDQTFNGDAGKRGYDEYRLYTTFRDTLADHPSPQNLKKVIVRSSGDHHYLIETEDSLYRMTQYTFTPFGFTKSLVLPVQLPDSIDGKQATPPNQLLDSIRKVAHAELVNGQILFDPRKEELENLFASSWAKKEHYIRMDLPAPANVSWQQTNWLTAALALISIMLFIILLYKKAEGGKKK